MPAARNLVNYREAMQNVYGAFERISKDKLSSWTPPPMSEGHRGRYLWTDGFGVVNFLTLYKTTSDERYLTLARRLIDTVHDILGRTRDGLSRLPRATDEQPLLGGLRIGKECDTGDDADGQYFHYLTVWMFALNRMSIAARDKWYNDQAITLAKAVHPHFVVDRDSARPRMYWKMSMDLSRPLVRSEGNLDPIDGYVTFTLLQNTSDDRSVLAKEISEYERIVNTKWPTYVSSDPLDLGMTLWTTHWLIGKKEWSDVLSSRAFRCLQELWGEGFFEFPVKYRLAFREFGTAMGIRCHHEAGSHDEWDLRAARIVSTWEERGLPGKLASTPERLQPITLVMYASAILPGGTQENMPFFCEFCA
jgi:hypothetical protein